MGNGALPRVDRIVQRDDNTVQVHIQTSSFKPGQEVAVYGYLTQANGANAAFNVKAHIPFDPGPPYVLNVELPEMPDLDPEEDVTVVTWVAEAWPSILEKEKDPEYGGNGLKAAWTYKEPPGKGSGDQASPPPNYQGGTATTNPQP